MPKSRLHAVARKELAAGLGENLQDIPVMQAHSSRIPLSAGKRKGIT